MQYLTENPELGGMVRRLEGAARNSLALVEHNVGAVVLQAVFRLQVAGLKVYQAIVVERSPDAPSFVFDERRVMAAAESGSNVVDDGIRVVDVRAVHRGIGFQAGQL